VNITARTQYTHSQSQVESSQMLRGEISHSLQNLLRC